MHPDDLSRRVATTAELYERGASPNRIRRMIQHGCLVRLTHGVYACLDRCARPGHAKVLSDLPVARLRTPENLLGARAVAIGRRLGPDAVITGAAVAALRGLPVIDAAVQPVDVRHTSSKTRSRGGYRRIAGHPPAGSYIPGEDLGIASLPMALADMASLSAEHVGLAALDVALSRGVGSRALIDSARLLPGPRQRRALGLIDLADPRAESPGESWARWLFHLHGLPAPELQARIFDGKGRFIARVDALWRDARLIFEFDGRVKYRGDGAGDAVFEEKVREDRLRSAGFTVVRSIWRDLYFFDTVADRLTSALCRGSVP